MKHEYTLIRKESGKQKNKNGKKEKTHSVIGSVYGMTLLLVAVLIINAVIGISSVLDMRDHNREVIEQTLKEYQEQQETRFNAARRFVEWSAVNEPLINDLHSHIGDALVSEDLNQIRSRVNEMKYSFGDGFMFFISMNEGRRFYSISTLFTGYSDYLGLKEALIKESRSGNGELKWKTYIPDNGRSPFLYYGTTYNHVYVACAINADYFTGSLNSLSLGRLGSVSFFDPDGNVLSSILGEGGNSLPYFYDDFEINYRKEGLPYSVKVYADSYTSFAEQQMRQFIILFVFLVIIGVSINFLSKIYSSILHPLENFENALINAEDEDSLITLESNSVKELEAASNQLKLLVNQIRDMRISIYEKELEKRKSKITFLQGQIKPHFYLNCLSTIDSMIQLEKYDEAQEMLLFTSKYIRYLFQAGRDFVRLEYELSHIEAYLDIQNMRMDHLFEYKSDIDKDSVAAMIPPLLIITFVENCVKHATPSDGQKLRISLSTKHVKSDSEDMLVIDIKDSGVGFPDALLEHYNELISAQITETNAEVVPASSSNSGSGNHIGIVNNIQRLKLIYGDDFNIIFSNDAFDLDALNSEASYSESLNSESLQNSKNNKTGAHISIKVPWKEEDTEDL